MPTSRRRVLRPARNNHNRYDAEDKFKDLAQFAHGRKPDPLNPMPFGGDPLLTAHLMCNIYEHAYLDGAWEYRERMIPRWLRAVLDWMGVERHQLRDHLGYGAESNVISRLYAPAARTGGVTDPA